MISILAKLFIKNNNNTKNQRVREAYGMLCGAVGIFLNLLLFGFKFLAGHLSRSIAITADAFNNLSDAFSSVVTLMGFKLAGQKPDSDHPFGHGRFEYISGLMVALAILLMGVELLKDSVERILHPEELVFSPMVLSILFASIATKLYMALYNKNIGKKINSAALSAVSMDSLSDMLSTFVVLISTLISHFTPFTIDAYCGVLVGLFVCYSGYKAVKETISPLLGQAPDEEFVRNVKEIVLSHEKVTGLHDLVVHNYGPGKVLISLHAEVPADSNLVEIHNEIDAVERKLKDTLGVSAVIHMDPVFTEDAEALSIKGKILAYLKLLDERISLHDFRIVKKNDAVKIFFDISVPFDFKQDDEKLVADIKERLLEENPAYIGGIEIDRQ